MDFVDQEFGKGTTEVALLCFMVSLAGRTEKAGGGQHR